MWNHPPAGRKRMLKLVQRMTNNFCAGVCASSVQKWEKLNFCNVGEDMRVMTRKNVNDPGEPLGVLLSAATSVWMPTTQKRLFDFLRDERTRIQWDILSNDGPMQEMVIVFKGSGHSNSVSLLCGGAINANENTMLILQETWSDASGAMVIYAPIDLSSLSIVVNGGDSAYAALLHLDLQSFPIFHLVIMAGKVTPMDKWRIRITMGHYKQQQWMHAYSSISDFGE